jgi:hypothetical protein
MFQEKELKTVSAGGNARGAAINAEYRNREEASKYSSEQRAQAQRIIDIMDLAYKFKATYINYRKTFIAVKIEDAMIKDRKLAKEVDVIFAERGYTKAKTPQGIVVRITKVI